jgi:hypothetical protein
MGAFFAILGLVVIGGGWLFHLRIQAKGRKAQAWPTTKGTVVSSDVAIVPMGDNKMQTPAVLYRYEVAGATVESTGFRVGAPPLFSKAGKAKALADKYPAGSQVTVHYDPAAPETAALDLKIGEGYGPLMLYSLGGTFFVLGVMSVVIGF